MSLISIPEGVLDFYTWESLGFLYLGESWISIPEGVLISKSEGVFDFYTWGRLRFPYLRASWISIPAGVLIYIPEGVLDFYTWGRLGFLYLRASWISIPEGVLDFYTWGSLSCPQSSPPLPCPHIWPSVASFLCSHSVPWPVSGPPKDIYTCTWMPHIKIIGKLTKWNIIWVPGTCMCR